jgi:hypothetical protein
MKRFFALPLLLALTAASAPPVSVEAADSDWSYLPRLSHRGYEHLNTKMMARLHEIASQNQCRLPGEFLGKRLDLRLSFAAQYDPDGTLRKIVIPKLNCPEAEGIIGGALLEMMKGGDYRPTGKNPDGWYRGNLTFGFEG